MSGVTVGSYLLPRPALSLCLVDHGGQHAIHWYGWFVILNLALLAARPSQLRACIVFLCCFTRAHISS